MIEFLGGTFVTGGDHLGGIFRWAQFDLKDGSRLELIAPLSPDSFVQRFLDQRGEGIHHVTYKVSDVEAAAKRAEALGYRTTGLEIAHRWSEVFLHPAEAHGVLIQLAAWPDNPWPPTTLEDVLNGRVIDD
jgi:methylmalonyl-CoA/ethylmalonyl-CoA epimerase